MLIVVAVKLPIDGKLEWGVSYAGFQLDEVRDC